MKTMRVFGRTGAGIVNYPKIDAVANQLDKVMEQLEKDLQFKEL